MTLSLAHRDFMAIATGRTFKGLHGGDVVRFEYRGALRAAAVIGALCFADHVVVRFTSCGHVVDSENFRGKVRSARRT